MTKDKQKELTKGKTIQIHGKTYMPVAQRILLAHEDGKLQAIHTAVLSDSPVVIQATITLSTSDGAFFTYQGISSVPLDSTKQIEKFNPYEVAETSAVGRALGFAGYGLIDSVASADEVHKSESVQSASHTAGNTDSQTAGHTTLDDVAPIRDCPRHPGKQAKYKTTPWGGMQWSHPEATEEKGWCNLTA